jgi:hypothetical protein
MPSHHLRPVPRLTSGPMRAGFSSRLTIRVEILGSVPPIWRVFTCPSDIRLDQLHRVLQTVVGWTDSHLHQFIPERVPGRPEVVFFDPGDEFAEDDDEGAVSESEVRVDRVLSRVGDTLGYVYDFGDHWEHTLTVEAVTDRDPRTGRCGVWAGSGQRRWRTWVGSTGTTS